MAGGVAAAASGPSAGASARARDGNATWRPTAHSAASAARRPGMKRASLIGLFLGRRFRRGLLARTREPIDVGFRQEIGKVLRVLRIVVDLVDAAQEFQQVLVGI